MDVDVGAGVEEAVGVAVSVTVGNGLEVAVGVGLGGDVRLAVGPGIVGDGDGAAVSVGAGCAWTTALGASVGGVARTAAESQAASRDSDKRTAIVRGRSAPSIMHASVVDQRAFDARATPAAGHTIVAAHGYAQIGNASFVRLARDTLQIRIAASRAHVLPKSVGMVDTPAQATRTDKGRG